MTPVPPMIGVIGYGKRTNRSGSDKTVPPSSSTPVGGVGAQAITLINSAVTSPPEMPSINSNANPTIRRLVPPPDGKSPVGQKEMPVAGSTKLQTSQMGAMTSDLLVS